MTLDMKKPQFLFVRTLTIFTLLGTILFAGAIGADAQKKASFSYNAQKKFIHPDLGKVYLGMPLHEFATVIDLTNASVADPRFSGLSMTIPVNKGNVTDLTISIHGLEVEGRDKYLREIQVPSIIFPGTHVSDTRIDISKTPKTGIIYRMSIDFKSGYDLRSYAVKTFGPKGAVHKPEDEYHFFDIQWSPKTSDGLTWLVRSFHEGESRQLVLIGRIKDTEWELPDGDLVRTVETGDQTATAPLLSF